MQIEMVIAAHDYHPMGQIYRGKEELSAAIEACLAPLDRIGSLIVDHPDMDDEAICALYNEAPMTPTLGVHVVRAVRRSLGKT